jgi:hypothetical protein
MHPCFFLLQKNFPSGISACCAKVRACDHHSHPVLMVLLLHAKMKYKELTRISMPAMIFPEGHSLHQPSSSESPCSKEREKSMHHAMQ